MSYFLSILVDGLSAGCVYALIAMGFAIVYGVLKLLNFAHSEVFTSGVFIALFVFQTMGSWTFLPPLLIVLLAVIAAGLGAGGLALLIERFAYRPFRKEPALVTLLTAIGTSILLKCVGLQVFGAHTRGFPVLDLPVSARGFAVIVLVASFAALWLLVNRTGVGLRMRAVSELPETSRLMGIDPNRVIVVGFFLGGACAGLAGVVWGIVYGTAEPQMGYLPGLKSFIIAVLGSIGRLEGTFLIAVLLGLLEAIIIGYLPAEFSAYRDSIVFAVLLLSLVARPTGLLGSRRVVKV